MELGSFVLQKKKINRVNPPDIDVIMGRLSSELLGLEDRLSIMRGIANALVYHLELSSAFIFAFNSHSSTFQCFKTDTDHIESTLLSSHPFFQYFNQPMAPTLLNRLPTDIQNDLLAYPFFKTSLIYPVHSFGALQGIFVLNPKKNGEPLRSYDHILLFTVIHQLLILFDRVAYKDHLAQMQLALDDATKAASIFWLINDYMHDLKTPWGLLQAATDPRSGCITPDDFRERITRHSKRAAKTLAIVNRILARDRKRVEVSIDLVAAVFEIIDAHSDMKEITFLQPTESCCILGDPSDIDILIINLIKNAKESLNLDSIEKNRVSVSVECDLKTVTLTVRDTGVGMSQETIQSILSGQAQTTKYFGSGVGTRAILRIVKDHGATLDIESVVGKGSAVKVTFLAK